MSVELLTEHHLELLSLNGGCKGSSESTLVKKPHCWKSHVVAHMHICDNTEISRAGPNVVLWQCHPEYYMRHGIWKLD